MRLFQIPHRQRIGHALALVWTAAFLAACGVTERISTSREVTVDSVSHSVPLPGHVFQRRFPAADSIYLEDERLKITLWRLPSADASAEDASPEARLNEVPPGVDSVQTMSGPGGDQYGIRAEIKPDTTEVNVPQKTITEKKETTKFIKQTPGLVKYIIGGLVMLILVLLVAWRIIK